MEKEMAETTGKAKAAGFMKPMQPSDLLARIVGAEPLPRSEVTKKDLAHIRKHNLPASLTLFPMSMTCRLGNDLRWQLEH
jgi:chromatin remodeling complex protein RSC6